MDQVQFWLKLQVDVTLVCLTVASTSIPTDSQTDRGIRLAQGIELWAAIAAICPDATNLTSKQQFAIAKKRASRLTRFFNSTRS